MPSRLLSHNTKRKYAYPRLTRTVWRYYEMHGRHDLPWRRTRDPYRILVAEIMLQQTQVLRVIPKYREFLKTFPTIKAVASAPLKDILVLWQGLGYNRRAKALHDTARLVCKRHNGILPHTEAELLALPGIGLYTARAVCAFAYNMSVPLLETNIRTVLLHELLPTRHTVPDNELWLLADELIDRTHPREWQWALMDYGAHLKARGIRINNASKHYVKQSKFKGSDREVRGALLRHLTKHPHASERTLSTVLPFSRTRIALQLRALLRDGLIQKKGTSWSI